MGTFDGKRVLVTGGGTGIGREIAHAFVRQGADVAICGRRPGPLKAARDDEIARRDHMHIIECDVSDPDDVASMAARIEKSLGGLDVLVNNAGVDERGSLEQLELRAIDRVLNINLRGAIITTRAMLPLLRRSGRGACVLNISSTLGQIAEESSVAYCISKAGLEMLTRCVALDCAPDGIRVNAIAPGVVDTPIQDHVKGELGYQEWRSQMEHLHPMQSIGRPKDVAAAALFLCSPDADWLTGVILPVDGGMTAR
ncbi:MAG: SDR family oxidoreductase [Planctomycetes bacterium]|nr:SDR family oxidoreductase [Planctomycetota bacterium]